MWGKPNGSRPAGRLEHDRDFKHGELFGPLTPDRIPAPARRLPPEPGQLLFERVGGMLKITRPDGSFTILDWDGSITFDRLVLNEGLPTAKLDRLLSYVWSYHVAYASTEADEEDTPASLFPWLCD